MNRNKTRWEYTIQETDREGNVKEHLIKGRTVSQLDMPEVMRKAGISASETAFQELLMKYPDIMVGVLLQNCVTSHKFGTGPGCDFSPHDLDGAEVRELLTRITRPFKFDMAKAALKYGQGVILDAVTQEELNDLLENGWFTPEEEQAVQAEVFLAHQLRADNSDPGQGDAQTPSRNTGDVL